MFGKPSNPYDEIIAKATDEKQTEMNWEVALTVWDKVNEDGETGARNSVNSLTKRLTHRSANVQLFSLTLAGALVNNCGASLHREISGKSFTQALTRLINDRTTHESVKKEALKCVEEWVKEHQGNGDFDLMNDTYDSLKRRNHKFPSFIERQSTPPRINDDALRREEEDLQRALAESAALTSTSSSSHYTPSQPPPTSKSLPSEPSPTPTRVEALFDFTGQTPEELEFRKGDVVKVVECLYQDWWKGELRGRVGIFPRNHVQPLPDLPPVPHSNPYSHHQSNDRAPPPPSASEEELEAEVFGQIASVDRLLQLMQTLRERGDDFADNDELTDLYNSSMMLRPRVVQLIRKYDQKKSDLTGMNEKVMQARGIYEQMTGGGQPQPQQQQQQHPYAHPHQQPQTNGYAHHPGPTQTHPEPQRTFSTSHSHAQPPPAIQQQAQLDPAEEQQIREYEAKWAEYERQMEEYNRQLAAHQQLYASQQTQSIPQGLPPQSIPSSDPAQPYPSPSPQPDPQLSRSQSYTQQPPSQQAPHSPPPPQQSQQAQPQPVWDGQAWVWPTQTAHVGSQSPQIGGLVEGVQGIDLRAQGAGQGQQGYYAGGGQEDPAQWGQGQGQHQQQQQQGY